MSYGIVDVALDELTGNAEYVSEQIFQKRVSLCDNCQYKQIFMPGSSGNCKLCGCFIMLKARYSKSVCPDTPPKW